jgi:glutamyl-tRNA synthetase
LITVRKTEDDTKIEDVVNKESKFETQALAEICINEVKQGDIIQLERRGYFYVDALADDSHPIRLHFVPDGKSKNISVIETKINVKTLSKGEEKETAESQASKKEAKADKKAKKEAKKEAKAEKKAEKKAEAKKDEAEKSESAPSENSENK